MLKTVDDFHGLLEDISSTSGFKKPLYWSVGSVECSMLKNNIFECDFHKWIADNNSNTEILLLFHKVFSLNGYLDTSFKRIISSGNVCIRISNEFLLEVLSYFRPFVWNGIHTESIDIIISMINFNNKGGKLLFTAVYD